MISYIYINIALLTVVNKLINNNKTVVNHEFSITLVNIKTFQSHQILLKNNRWFAFTMV